MPIGQSWTFVDAEQQFADEKRPFPYSQVLEVDNLSEDHLHMDFVGVKMGDVNGNVLLQSTLLGITRSIETIELSELSRQGNRMVVGLTPNDDAELAGLQLSLGLGSGVRIERITSDQIEIGEDNYTVIDGELRISWNSIQSIETNTDALIKIELTMDKAGMTLEETLSLKGDHLASEIYTEQNGEFTTSDVHLQFASDDTEQFILEQNVPNPFNGTTVIRFYQPVDGDVSFRITDLSGRIIVRRTNRYSRGWHELTVDSDDLQGSGIYIYELSNGADLFRKKMITIE